MTWTVPEDLTRRMEHRDAEGGPDGPTWLAALPRLVRERLEAWELAVDGEPMNGHNALVLPVRRTRASRGAERLVLKVTWPHPEAADEHLGLRRWAGDGIVALAAADPASTSLLLERLGPDDLTSLDEYTATTEIGALLRRLHVPPPPSVRSFTEATGSWFAPLRDRPERIPRRWVERTLEVYDHRVDEHVLLHGDLHFENVLSAEREPWLAIDPKPMAGPRAFDLYPLLGNRVEDYGTGTGFGGAVRRRLEWAADAARIDLDAARDWCVAHAVLNAYEYGAEGWPTLTTLNLAIATAVDAL